MGSDEDKRKYPWNEEKRAWIFYLDKIKEDINKISGEVDGNVYLLDCETAKLSVWMKEENIFTAVGVSSLLEQIECARSGKIQNISRGTRILYKGIELHNAYMEHDTELLEYIDIKRELDREHIDISRYGFTVNGKHFFQERLYPKLLDVIRRVLDKIREQAKSADFVKRICIIADDLCTGIESAEEEGRTELSQKKQKQLISLVIGSAVLSYYAMRDEWDIMEGFDEKCKHGESVWEKLVIDLNNVLERHWKALDILADKSVLFNIKAINEKYADHLIRGERDSNIHFLKIFLPDAHWAILQKRKNQFDVWTSYLILLENMEDGKSPVLEKLISFPHTKKDDKLLEKWGEQICTSVEKIDLLNAYGMQVLLGWMQKTIPTVGLFSNQDGNIRVNVLYNRIFPSIYVNRNFRSLLLERMMEYAEKDNIQRFSTITWQKRERIGMDNLPFSIFFVKRGYMASYSYHKSIVPVDGNLLKLWGKILAKSSSSDALERFKTLCKHMDVVKCLNEIRKTGSKSIQDYWLSDSNGAGLNVSEEILSTVCDKIVKTSFRPRILVRELLSDKPERFQEWIRLYQLFAELQAREFLGIVSEEDDRMLEEIEENPEWESLCSAWIYFCFRPDELAEGAKEIEKSYDLYMQNPVIVQNEERMLKYMENHLRYTVRKELIRTELEQYREEWVGLAVSMERRPYLKMVDELLEAYGTMKQQLIAAYEKNRRDKK